MLLQAVRVVDGWVVRAGVRYRRSQWSLDVRRRPTRFQRRVWRHPGRSGALFGVGLMVLMLSICLIAGWRVEFSDAPSIAGVAVVPGTLLALVVRWERMTYEAMEHGAPVDPLPLPPWRKVATRLGLLWVVFTVLNRIEHPAEGWPGSAGWGAFYLLLALGVGLVVAGAAERRRRRRK
ncbi:hypothetical protein [Streptomyces sp. VRA16 Mangrove soil]|uniref:hypothetical protein n=1 Tax=Streptomyces sp. VRA16 Mangrove soil TaxID=2817434 RepID=UPI001A9D8FE5|nr:hypothetical protein [Streptomyces sp. VRA16 Mangrove soil]MBO1335540.1 hypothetical protein [Streptomyces sp. VRA16 Mangrove soil]